MKQLEKKDLVVKATLWYTISNIILRCVSFITTPIFARILSTSDYGIASNYSSWASILICITGLGLSAAIVRGKVEFGNEFKEFLSSVQMLGVLWCLFCSLILFLFKDFVTEFMELDLVCFYVLILYLLFYPSLTYAQIDLRFDYKYKENVFIAVFSTIITIAVSIVLILIWPEKKYLGRIIGLAFPSIFFGIFSFFIILKNGKKLICKKYWQYSLKLAIPMIPHSLSMIVLGQVDRVMIMKFCGESDAGIYSFGYTYAVLLAVVTNSINDAVQPQMYEMLNEKNHDDLRKFSMKLMAIGGLLSLIIITIAPEMLIILGSEAFYTARWVIFPVVIGTLMQFFYQFFSVIEIFCKKTSFMALGSCCAALVNYFLNLVFIPKYGFVAAAYTTLISYALLMIFHFFVGNVLLKIKVYKFNDVIIISIIYLILGFIINILYDFHWGYRYGVSCLFIFVIAFCVRKTLFDLLRKVSGRIKRR